MKAKVYDYVCSQTDPQWFEERRKVFTASEIAAFFGEGYKSQKQVLAEKVGNSDRSPPTPGDSAWWGLRMERANLYAFSTLSGLRAKPVGAFLVSRRSRLLGATLDGLVREGGRTGILEMKNVDTFDLSGQDNRIRWRNEWGPEKPHLPRYRWIQVQCQLYVSGLPFAYLCAKIGACDMHWIHIEPDELFFEDLEAVAKRAQAKLDKLRESRKINNEVFE